MKKVGHFLLVMVLLFGMVGCQTTLLTNSDTTTTTTTSTVLPVVQDETLLAVLSSETPFVTETGKTVYLKDYSYYEEAGAPKFFADQYTFVDMDQDGQDEMVVKEEQNLNASLVFHKDGDTVYGYLFYVRMLQDLKQDGSFAGSGSAFLRAFSTVTFNKTEYTLTDLAVYEYYGEGAEENEFSINGNPVSETEINAFLEERAALPDAQWLPVG